VAKGIASGMPLGAMIARADIMDWEPGSHANTFGGNPVACAAACETIRLVETKLMRNAAAVGDYLKSRLNGLARRFPVIGDVRGLGLMAAIEIVCDRAMREPDPKLRDQIVYQAFKRGLLLLGCGESSIRFSPPLVVTKKEVDAAMGILEKIIGYSTLRSVRPAFQK